MSHFGNEKIINDLVDKCAEKKIPLEGLFICPYCDQPAEWVENKEIYGKNYGKSVMVWLCRPCDAYVGCHNNTKKPLGIMADIELRTWKNKAHHIFDKQWKGRKRKFRVMAYKRLDEHFGFEVHIGESDVKMCKKIIEFCTEYEQAV